MRLIAIAVALAGCRAELPELTDAQRTLDTACAGPYADLLVDTFPTSLANASAALGAPDSASVMLAANNVLTVGFVGLGGVTDAQGSDVRIHGTLNGSAVVRVATSEMEFRYAGEVNAGMPMVDIQVADLSSAIYIRVAAISGTLAVDAVEATHDTCQ